MGWKLVRYAAGAYIAYSRAVDALCRNLKVRFRRELDVVEHAIMALPMIAIVLWLFGVR